MTNPRRYDNIILEKEKVSVPTASALPSEVKSAQQPKGEAVRFFHACIQMDRTEFKIFKEDMAMKKIIAILLLCVFAFTLFSCDVDLKILEDQEDEVEEENISEYIVEEDGNTYLILPISKQKIRIDKSEFKYLNSISFNLLKKAEKKITNEASEYGQKTGFYLSQEENNLYLCMEVIVELPSKIIDGYTVHDHEHKFFKEKITKNINGSQSTDNTVSDLENEYLTPGVPNFLESNINLSDYFMKENFVPGLSQGQFLSMIESFSYNDKSLMDILSINHYDGPNGGGCFGGDDLFYISNDYNTSDITRTCTNYFKTTVSLDGLDLPFGITFNDTLDTALEKLMIDFDVQSDFSADDPNAGIMTLYKDESSYLKFVNHLFVPSNNGPPAYNYTLQYSETYKYLNGNGTEVTVKRTVTMDFANNNKLGSFLVLISEKY